MGIDAGEDPRDPRSAPVEAVMARKGRPIEREETMICTYVLALEASGVRNPLDVLEE